MKKWLKYLLLSIGFVLLLILVGYLWLTRSEAGTRWILGFAESTEKPLIAFANINGSINNGIRIGEIRYVDAGTDVTISQLNTQIDYHLFPLTVEIKSLDINKLAVLSEDIATAEAAAEEVATDLSLPLTLDLKALKIKQLIYRDVDMQITADNTHISLLIAEELNIRELKTSLAYLAAGSDPDIVADESQAIGAELELSGQSGLSAPWKHQLELQLIPLIDAVNPDPYLQLINGDSIKLISSGNTQHMKFELNSNGDINLSLTAELRDVLEEFHWQAQLQSEQLALPLAEDSSIELQQLTINSSGGMNDWQLDSTSQLTFTDSQAESINGQWQLSSNGNQQSIDISRLGLDGDIGKFDFHGNINPNELAIAGELEWKNLKAGAFVPEWPHEVSSSGHSRLEYQNNELSVTDLLALIDNTAARLEGDINVLTDTIDARLNWQNLSWPLESTSADFASNSGNVSVNGTLDNYQLNAQFELAGTEIPAGVYQLEGKGSQTGIQLQRVNSQILDGELNIRGDIQWQPELLAKLKVNGKNINPGSYWPDYPGSIGMDLQLQWQAGSEPEEEQLNIHLHQLDGQLRDYPLQASGKIQLLGGNDADLDINASSGNALLELQGQTGLDDPLAGNATFKIEVPDLAQIISDASGRINAHGKLQQSVGGQQLVLNLQAGKIKFAGSSLATADLDINTVIPSDDGQTFQLAAKINTTSLNLADLDLPIESINITVEKPETTDQQHLITLNIDAGKNALETSLQGKINLNQGNFSLDGMLQSMNVFTPVTGKLALQEPAQIQYADMQLLLTPACFRQQPDDLQAEICLLRQPTENNKQTQTRLQLDNFPLAWITAFFPVDLAVSQNLSGEVTLSGDQPITSIESIDGRISVSPGIIASVDLDSGMLETEEGLLEFKLDTGSQFKGLFDLPFKVGTGLKFDFNIENNADFETATIESQLDIVLDDLIALKWLIPGLDDLTGTFETHLQVQGKLTDPEIKGVIDINDVGLVYTPLGLDISKLNLDGKLASGTKSNLQGSFLAGEGEGKLQVGVDNSSKQSSLSFSITGTDLQLLNAPGLKLKASPDLSAVMSGNQLAVSGSIDIPSAQITPPPGTISSTPVSDDVVVTGLDIEEEKEDKALPLDINGMIKVTLGDDVHFIMDIIKSRLAGSVDLLFEGNSGIPMATGSIQLVDGFFHQYGQNLSFMDSQIRFDGKAVTNPILDIYAVRHIFADPEVELAGVNIAGRPDSIRLKLYTDPETDQESAVAYLATGSNFDHGNGVGALNIGTYIAPKLFVSYGIGLFDTGNEVSARYELTKNWAIQGTSAESGSGVDVLYSIDR